MDERLTKHAAAFPTRLTAMERLHLLRHRQDMPNVVLAHLEFVGTVQRDLFEKAFDLVMLRHELGNARFDPKNMTWDLPLESTDKQSVVVFYDRSFDSEPYRARPVSLSEGESFRLEVFIGENRVDIVTQAHHAKTDGLGAVQGIREILCAYHNLTQGNEFNKGLRKLNPEVFKTRHRLKLFQKGWLKRAPFQWIPIFGAIKFGLARVSHLRVDRSNAEPIEPLNEYPTYLHEKLDKNLYKNLLSKDKSVNQVILTALFLAVDQFQSELKLDRKNRIIRIVVPISVRDREDMRGSCCNRMSFVQLDRSLNQMKNPASLIWGINYELGFISKFKFEKAALIVLGLMSRIPGFMKWRIGKRKINATTLLTNVGNPFRSLKIPHEKELMISGDMKCVDVELIAPFYDLTPAVILFSTYASMPAITLNYDSRILTREQSQRLMDLLLQKIKEVDQIENSADDS